MTEQEFKEIIERKFGGKIVEEFWEEVMRSSQIDREKLVFFIATLPAETLDMFLSLAWLMAPRMKNDR
jgi:hypothetical protein